MARNKAGHPLCRHERPTDTRELCHRWWCCYRLELGFYTLCVGLVALVWWWHAPDWKQSFQFSRHASHAICRLDGTCRNDLGQTWLQSPGSMPLLGPNTW